MDTCTIDESEKAHQVFDEMPTTHQVGAVSNSLMDKENGDRVAVANFNPASNSIQPNKIYPDEAFHDRNKQAGAGSTFINRGNIGSQNNTTGNNNRVDACITGPITFSRPTTD